MKNNKKIGIGQFGGRVCPFVSDVIHYMGAVGQPFATCDVTGLFWSDVYTVDDYATVVSLLD